MGKTFTLAPPGKSGSAVLEPSWESSTDSDDGAASHLSGQNLIRTNEQNIVDSCETRFSTPLLFTSRWGKSWPHLSASRKLRLELWNPYTLTQMGVWGGRS